MCLTVSVLPASYVFGGRNAAALYVFSGVRPSSGAETQGQPVAFGETDPPERADVAAAEDGRTPLNTYAALGGSNVSTPNPGIPPNLAGVPGSFVARPSPAAGSPGVLAR
jgi:hypothetical protein